MYRADTPAYTRKNRETKGGLWHMTVNFLRTMILYIVIVVAVRIMGKRQIGELLSHRAGHHHLFPISRLSPIEGYDIPLDAGAPS